MHVHGITVSRYEFAEGQPAEFWNSPTPLAEAMAAAVAPRTEAVFAVVNHGRWVVECPNCSAAQLGCLTDHRFMCHNCANVAIGGLWRPVLWPAGVQDISAVIADRDDRKMQNYEPGETLGELREQNRILDADGLTALSGVARYVPGADTDAEVAGAASDFEGHTHTWPKTIKGDKDYRCPVCGLEVDGLTLLLAEKSEA